MDKISFVLPLKIYGNEFGSDLERVKNILIPSIIKYFNVNQIEKFFIITISSEHDEVSRELSIYENAVNLSIIPEESLLLLVPGWERHCNLHNNIRFFKSMDMHISRGKTFELLKLKDSWFNLPGWYKQQMLKMFSALLIRTGYYMTLDADLCLTRPADMSTLFPEGRAIYTPEDLSINHDWWLGSAKVLDIDHKICRDNKGMGVTPEIISTLVMKNLVEYLNYMASTKKYSTLFEYLSANRCWSEYTLYWLYLLKHYNVEDFYRNANISPPLESCHSVWFKDQALDKKAFREKIDAAFAGNGGLFLIIQSNCIPLSEYYEIIRNHLITIPQKDYA